MLVYLLAGLIIIVACKILEQRHKVKKSYSNLRDYVSYNIQSWEYLCGEIMQNKNIHSLENIIGKSDVYLIEKKDSGVKVIALNNGGTRIMSELQYQRIVKKTEKQNPIYSFNIDMSSIYYHFDYPNENYVLWIYIH